MRQVVVHIGLEKAASTSLQASLVGARDRLAAEGIVFPQLGGGGVKDQRDLRFALAGDRQTAARVAQTLEKSAREGARQLVLSGETLYHHSPDALLSLLHAGGWGDARVRAVAIVREPAGWLNSRYAFEVLSFRHRVSFPRFVTDRLPAEGTIWMRPMQAWLACGGMSVHAVPLRSREDAASPIARAVEALGIDPALVPEGEALNEGHDQRTVEAARRLALYRIPAAGIPFMRQVRQRMMKAARAEGLAGGRFHGLDAELAQTIDRVLEPELQAFAHAVWQADWHEVYAPSPAALPPVNEWGRAPAGRGDEAAIRRVVAAVRRREHLRARLVAQLVPSLAARIGTKG